jgi:hypothetical protein
LYAHMNKKKERKKKKKSRQLNWFRIGDLPWHLDCIV